MNIGERFGGVDGKVSSRKLFILIRYIFYQDNTNRKLCGETPLMNCINERCLNLHLTNCMEQSPREVSIPSASHGILWILWNPKVYFRVQNSLPLDHILSLMSSIHTLTSCWFKSHLNVLIFYFRVFQVVSFLQIFPWQALMHFFTLHCLPHSRRVVLPEYSLINDTNYRFINFCFFSLHVVVHELAHEFICYDLLHK